jgi:hypothetical protein
VEYPPELLAAWTIYTKGVPYYKWLQFPENAKIAENFNLGMRGYNVTEGMDFLPLGTFLRRFNLMVSS